MDAMDDTPVGALQVKMSLRSQTIISEALDAAKAVALQQLKSQVSLEGTMAASSSQILNTSASDADSSEARRQVKAAAAETTPGRKVGEKAFPGTHPSKGESPPLEDAK